MEAAFRQGFPGELANLVVKKEEKICQFPILSGLLFFAALWYNLSIKQ